VRTLLSSPRRRRRLAWTAGVVLALAAIVGAGIKFSYTGPGLDVEPSNEPAVLYKEPKSVRLGARSRADALAVAEKFIRTAVARKRVGESWNLVAPELKDGFTKAEWARGEIPVVPFPAASARWRVDYSYRNKLGLRVALFPPVGARTPAAVFDLDLMAMKVGKDRHWRVSSFMPSVQRAPLGNDSGPVLGSAGVPRVSVPEGESRLSAAWLLVPLGLLSLVLLVPLAIGLGHWYRRTRAERAYAREMADAPPYFRPRE
jgi:hypothetical protein